MKVKISKEELAKYFMGNKTADYVYTVVMPDVIELEALPTEGEKMLLECLPAFASAPLSGNVTEANEAWRAGYNTALSDVRERLGEKVGTVAHTPKSEYPTNTSDGRVGVAGGARKTGECCERCSRTEQIQLTKDNSTGLGIGGATWTKCIDGLCPCHQREEKRYGEKTGTYLDMLPLADHPKKIERLRGDETPLGVVTKLNELIDDRNQRYGL